MTKNPKIGARVKWTSLDSTVPPSYGTIVELSPSKTRAEIQWDDDDETRTYDLSARASGVRLL